SHRDVDLVSFTGSAAVGRAIAAQGAASMKRIILELGGKSVALHLPDTFADGVAGAVRSSLMVFGSHAGQGCSLQTRVLVPHDQVDAVSEALAAAIGSLTVGDPRERSTVVGPVITAAHRDRIAGLV